MAKRQRYLLLAALVFVVGYLVLMGHLLGRSRDVATAGQPNDGFPIRVEQQFRRGEAYHKSLMFQRNRPPDYARASLFYRQAAEQGHTEAQYALASLYMSGEGVDQDYLEAEKWYVKAAEQGHEEAQSSLERIKERGQIPEKQEEAR